MTIGNSKTVLTFGRIKELTAENAELFRREVQASVDGQQVIKVDLSQTTSMDCAGLGALVALRNLARDHHSKVRLLNPTTPVQRLFDLMHLEAAFEIVQASPETHPQICQSPLPPSHPRPVSAEISNREPELVAQPALERGR